MERRPWFARLATVFASLSFALAIVALLVALPGVAKAAIEDECIEVCVQAGGTYEDCIEYCASEVYGITSPCIESCIEAGGTYAECYLSCRAQADNEACVEACIALGLGQQECEEHCENIATCTEECMNAGGSYAFCHLHCAYSGLDALADEFFEEGFGSYEECLQLAIEEMNNMGWFTHCEDTWPRCDGRCWSFTKRCAKLKPYAWIDFGWCRCETPP